MPTSPYMKLNAFLDLIFAKIINTKDEYVELSAKQYKQKAKIFLGVNYRTIRDYEDMMRDFDIMLSKGVKVKFSKKGYFNFKEDYNSALNYMEKARGN